jgi:carboxymethylenebutenolidase
MTDSEADLGAVFDAHVKAEFVDLDVDAAMATMTADPYLTHIPALTGGYGHDELTTFYRDHFVGKWPADTTTEEVSRTVGDHRVIDEMILRFTHDIEMDGILPGVAPTGRSVEMALAVVVDFEGGKISAERISWDQASVLVQLGLLDPTGLPVTGAEQAQTVQDPTRPRNQLLGENVE